MAIKNKKFRRIKVAYHRYLGLLIVLYVMVGATVAFFQLSKQKEVAFSFLPISQNLQRPKIVVSPPLNVNNEPALVTAADTITPTSNGFAIRVPVLTYHYIRDNVSPKDKLGVSLSVSTKNFEDQIAYLAENGYQVLTPADLFASLQNKTSLGSKAVILTFDDGYEDFYTNAYPILKKYQLKATLFMIAGWVGRNGYLTADQLRQMSNEGLVDIESHTLNHLDLTTASKETARKEIFDSKIRLETLLGKKVLVFCYPYGNYNADVAAMVEEAGYEMAFSTRYGASENEEEIFKLRRVRINGPDSLKIFQERLLLS